MRTTWITSSPTAYTTSHGKGEMTGSRVPSFSLDARMPAGSVALRRWRAQTIRAIGRLIEEVLGDAFPASVQRRSISATCRVWPSSSQVKLQRAASRDRAFQVEVDLHAHPELRCRLE
jgi:hypothetical protein